ncbi:MAG TPA: putative lipopolysaccharide heptosyltransferase III [Thermodesulfobacteriota bacterium]|nr:putative lipopolysaccharide heptosyltransferase III [Thermodesulfobacteriota bacterium]
MKSLNLQNPPVRKILLIRLRNIGDVLLLVPTLRAFREAFPQAHLAVAVNAGTEEMLTGNPLLDEILVFDPRWKRLPFRERVAQEGKFVWEVRKRGFDLAINTTEGDRGAFLCLSTGARIKVGLYDASGLWWKGRVYDHLVRIPDWKSHLVEQMLEIPRSLGLSPQDKRVEIFYPPGEREFIDRLLEKEGIGPGEDVVHIHPTSRWLFKCWRDEAMARVIDQLEEKRNIRTVLTSGKEEKELKKIDHILHACRTHPVSLAGKVTLKQLAALSARARLFLGVDTAPMHIAAAVGTPVIALFGPSGEFNWGPWGNRHVVIKKDWDCRPCGQDGCQGSKRSRCLEEISEEEVLEEAFRLLAEPRKRPLGGIP